MVQLIQTLRQKPFFQLFTVYLRYLIGGVFIMAAFLMGKISAQKMPIVGQDIAINDLPPMSQFFKVITESGLYWQFIGWVQIITGALLITQRFAKLGALLFTFMMVNIFIITVSYHFQGTPVVTGLMLLAGVYLMLWDYESFLFLIAFPVRPQKPLLYLIDNKFWIGLGVVLIVVIAINGLMRFNILVQLGVPALTNNHWVFNHSGKIATAACFYISFIKFGH